MLANLIVYISLQRATIERYSEAYQYSLFAVNLLKWYSSSLILVILFHMIWMIDMILRGAMILWLGRLIMFSVFSVNWTLLLSFDCWLLILLVYMVLFCGIFVMDMLKVCADGESVFDVYGSAI